MKTETLNIYNELFERYPSLTAAKDSIAAAFGILEKAVANGKKIVLCGNGGSAADCEHIVGELMKSFKKKRPIDAKVFDNLSAFGEEVEKLKNALDGTIRATSLTAHVSLSTAFANDKEPTVGFAQQLYGLADEGDALLTISTSGNSENCVLAAITAKAKGMKVVALTGKNDSRLSRIADVTITVPETETYKVQELHLPIYHCLCAMLEEENF